MGNKIFVSYKYRDFSVCPLEGFSTSESYTRGYVDYLQNRLVLSDHIYKGEEDDNDLSQYSDVYIEEQLKRKIADSSVTIVLISPEMRNPNERELNQWIPWEVSYSLKEIVREDRKSHTNAVLGVVLPDKQGSYEYVITRRTCCRETCCNINISKLFTILEKNIFNRKKPESKVCERKENIYYGEHSYIPIVK